MAVPDALDLEALRPLAQLFPTLDAVLAERARLAAECTLPKGTVHVLSDIHGEDRKLRHVINNASGTLRPLIEGQFANRVDPLTLRELVTLVFYPGETLRRLEPTLADPQARRDYCRATLARLLELVHVLARRESLRRVETLLPPPFRPLLLDILTRAEGPAGEAYLAAAVDALVDDDRAWQLLRVAVRLVRNLAVAEIVIAGDCWDRGPRGDRVVEYLRQQPDVAFVWGNHDAAWLGACLGQEALIAHVLRISLRYRRLSQLEEGYGILLQPLEQLARTVYADDPADNFIPRGSGLRDTGLMARMQKAAAVLQFKLEGATIARHPGWQLDHRRLLHRLNLADGTVEIDGRVRRLKDRNFPTLDPADPYALSPEERSCLDRIRRSFLGSQVLWEHMNFLARRGAMWLVRDGHLIFHGCVPVEEDGTFQTFDVAGEELAGRPLFDALEAVLTRTLDEPTEYGRDLLWYLWCGPRSPLFGKDRIATFEIDFVADAETHLETKNPYFRLIHEAPFCDRILQEFGVDPARGLIVNGHVPVKIDKGESPLKKSGKAITIDGAFSEAYGDHGYTLVLEPERTSLARHHHFESVDAAVEKGVDIIPEVLEVRRWLPHRRVGDTEEGQRHRARMHLLDRLAQAYRDNRLRQADA